MKKKIIWWLIWTLYCIPAAFFCLLYIILVGPFNWLYNRLDKTKWKLVGKFKPRE